MENVQPSMVLCGDSCKGSYLQDGSDVFRLSLSVIDLTEVRDEEAFIPKNNRVPA